MLERLGIDVAVSPREAMARQIMGLVSKGPIRERTPIAGDVAEVWEVEVRDHCAATDKSLRELSLTNCVVAAIEREEHIRVPNADDQLQPGDTVVLLVQRDSAESVEALFN